MQNSWIPLARGCTTPQARVGVRHLNEEHLSREGFFGPATMLYHRRAPADPVRVEGPLAVKVQPLATLGPGNDDEGTGLPTPLLYNDRVTISVSRRAQAAPFLLRNVDADTLLFVHEGTGELATEFGTLRYEEGDFVLLPKSVTYRAMPASTTTALVVESVDPISFTEHRQVGRHAPFDPGVIATPDVTEYDWPDQDEWELRLKHGAETTSAYYAELPFDVIGWKGDLFPLKLNIRDIRPITSERLHLAPSAWSVFEAAGFMCVAFVPMSIVLDADAEELPSRHRNIDTEEAVLMRRVEGKPVNLLGHFPQSVTHGPVDRGDYDDRRSPGMQRMLEGVSIDTYERLKRTVRFDATPSVTTSSLASISKE